MQTEDFLKHFPGTVFQTFDDKAQNSALARCSSSISLSELKQLNEQGAGVFFSPNAFPDGNRKQHLCQGINAWFCEMDEGTIDEQLAKLDSSPIFPSLVVRSQKSLHCYWLVKPTKKATIQNWKPIINGLIYHFNADPACKDLSRVLRLPGFYHHKKEPFLIEVALNNAESTYTEEDMLAAFPLPPELDLYYLSNLIPSKPILELASGLPLVNGDTYSFRSRTTGGEFIDVNDKPADAWIDENGKIGSGKDGGPTWLQWFKFYNASPKDIKNFLLTKAKHLLPSKLDSEISAIDLIEELRSSNQKQDFFTFGTPGLDRSFSPLARAKYVLLVGETGTGKTEFSFQMAYENAKRGYKVLYLSLEMSNAQLIRRHALKRANITQEQFRNNQYDFKVIEKIVNELPKNLKFHDILGEFKPKDLEILISSKGYDIVFIDNLGFVDSSGANSLDRERNLSKALKEVKDRTGCTIVALHHFKKSDSSKQETGVRIRSVDSILGSAKTSHDVDAIYQVARDKSLPADADPQDKAELLVVQQKDRDWGQYTSESVYFQNGFFSDSFRAPNFDSKQGYTQSGMLYHFEEKNSTQGKYEPLRGMSDVGLSVDEAFEDLI